MKNKFFSKKPSGLTPPKISGAIALACGFWVSQSIACDLVSSSMLGELPNTAGALSLATFVLFFIVRMFRAWSRLPAILGLCSLGVLTMLILSATRVNYGFQMQPTGTFVLLSLGFAFAGIALDAEAMLAPDYQCRNAQPDTNAPLRQLRRTCDSSLTL